jgi:uncharacterized protein (TIGR00369 family)
MSVFESNIGKWLQAKPPANDGAYHFVFAEHHIGNVWIRSIHGGVSACIIETCAEAETRKLLEETQDLFVTTSTIDYLRITKDDDIHARATIVRKSRRLSIVDVVIWQDEETVPVARGTVTLKISFDE